MTPAGDGDPTDRPVDGAPAAETVPVPQPRAQQPAAAAKRTPARAKAASRAKKPARIAAAQQGSDTVRNRNASARGAAGDDGAEPTPEETAEPTAEMSAGVEQPDPDATEILPVPEDKPTLPLPATGPVPAQTAEPPAATVPDAPVVRPDPPAAAPVAPPAPAAPGAAKPASRFATRPVLRIEGLAKRFGPTVAVADIDLVVQPGSFYGIVGPNGAGKTTTLSMITGLLRPDTGTVHVHGIDVWREPERAKRAVGVLPDALRLFDRLSGAQLLYYSGVLRGLDAATVKQRSADLVQAFGLEDATGRLVADYSAGMTKKIALACAMIHSPRLLVLDEPFESVDPVSAANIIEILQRYVRAGGTVVLSSHGMDLIQRICDHVAIIIAGRVLASGTVDEVRGTQTLEERFVTLAGGRKAAEGLEWLHSFSD